jgi:mono/diheme cytochrome c family protein
MKSAISVLSLPAIVAVVLMSPSLATAQNSDPDPTYAKDVAPIFQRSCQVCHRPNNMAPMSLMTYQESRPWARSIKERVMTRVMPPWHMDHKVGVQEFKGDRSLSDAEIDTIVRWVDAGAPMGNPADMPPAVELPDFGAWTIEPDVIVTSPPHTVPPEAGDWWGDYIVDSGITEDRYIQAVQTKAGDLRVVHHVLTYAVTDSDADLNDSSGDFFLNEYAVGKNADQYPEGTGRLFEADSRVRFSFHYHSVGEEVTDQTELGLKLYPRENVPERILYSRQLGQAGELDIPAGQITRHDGYATMYLPGRLTAFQPHMHFLGKRQCLELIYPDSTTEMVSCVNFDFNWHIVYNYADDVQPIYPAGTKLHVISYHDNTEAHRGNVDSANWAGGGSRSIDEMAFGWVSWFDLSEEDYAEELAIRAVRE